MKGMRVIKKNIIFVSLFFCGCMAGPMSIAMDRERTTYYNDMGEVVSVSEKNTINEPIAKSTLATVAVGLSSEPIAAAIVAGAQSIGDGIGNFVKKSGDTVNDTVTAATRTGSSSNYNLSASAIGKPRPIPAAQIEGNERYITPQQ